MIRRPPRSTRTDTLFPYTTLFRSTEGRAGAVLRARSNLPPGAAPIRFPEFPLEHLARILAREFGLEDNRPGNLVSGEPCAKDPLHLIGVDRHRRSEEHTSELQSLMRISYAVFCLTKKINS